MLLSSGVIWRHRSLDDFRAECPGGDPALQARLVEELDDALDWLERLGIEPVRRETGNPLTVGRRYDTRALTEVLVRAAGDVRLREPFHEAAGARHGRLRRAAGAGARPAAARGALERGRRACARPRSRRRRDRGDGRVLRARPPRPCRRGRVRACVAALRAACARARRRRTRSRRGCLARERHRPAVPGREGVVRDRRTRAASAGAGADRGRPRRRGACRGRRGAPGGGVAVPAAGVAEARRAAVPGGAGLRRA